MKYMMIPGKTFAVFQRVGLGLNIDTYLIINQIASIPSVLEELSVIWYLILLPYSDIITLLFKHSVKRQSE